jgi:hypothetical protein
MQETLAGRLKWERIPGGIQISIPVRRGASTIGYVGLVVVWLTIASIHYWHLFSQQRTDDPAAMYELIAVGIYVVGFFFFLGWMAWVVTGETLLLLDEGRMTIQQRVMGIDISTQSYNNHEVHSFTYVRPKPFWALRADTDPSSSRIRFSVAGKYHFFARGISESEAYALVERMVEIYRFPGSGEQYWGAVTK